MSSMSEEQQNEVEALQAIYAEDFESTGPNTYKVTLRASTWTAMLDVEYPAGYPEQAINVRCEDAEPAKPEAKAVTKFFVSSIDEYIQQEVARRVGCDEVYMFDLIQQVIDHIDQLDMESLRDEAHALDDSPQAPEDICYLQLLPDEVLLPIMSNMIAPMLIKLCMTCRRFATLGLEGPMWDAVCAKYYGVESGGRSVARLVSSACLYTWGGNDRAALGLTPSSDQPLPCIVDAMSGKGVRKVVAGDGFTLALTFDNQIYSFGNGKTGCLGHGFDRTTSPPLLITSLETVAIRGVAAGPAHVVAWDAEGRVYSWGTNVQGCLGLGALGMPNGVVLSPTRVRGAIEDEVIVDVAAGQMHTVAVSSSGSVYSWGSSSHGQGGRPHPPEHLLGPTGLLEEFNENLYEYDLTHYWSVNVPEIVPLPRMVTRVACGGHQTLLLTDQGRVFGCGKLLALTTRPNFHFAHVHPALDVPPVVPYVVPLYSTVDGWDSRRFVQITAGDSHAGAVTSTGEAWVWGNAESFTEGGSGLVYSPQPLHASRDSNRHNVQRLECRFGSTVVIYRNGDMALLGEFADSAVSQRLASFARASAYFECASWLDYLVPGASKATEIQRIAETCLKFKEGTLVQCETEAGQVRSHMGSILDRQPLASSKKPIIEAARTKLLSHKWMRGKVFEFDPRGAGGQPGGVTGFFPVFAAVRLSPQEAASSLPSGWVRQASVGTGHVAVVCAAPTKTRSDA